MIYILVGAVTTAARLKKLLDSQAGIPSDIVRTPSKIKSGGCSYSVKINRRFFPEAKEIILDYGINVRKIYEERAENGERVYHAVS